MKVAALTRLINDHSTKHRIRVLCTNRFSILVYEGNPNNIDKETSSLEVNSFTALGKGFIEIYAQ